MKNKIYKISYLKRFKEIFVVLQNKKGDPVLYISPEVEDIKVLENGAIIAPPNTYYSDNFED